MQKRKKGGKHKANGTTRKQDDRFKPNHINSHINCKSFKKYYTSWKVMVSGATSASAAWFLGPYTLPAGDMASLPHVHSFRAYSSFWRRVLLPHRVPCPS